MLLDSEPSTRMTVQVKLYAGLQGLVGSKVVDVSMPDGATVSVLRDRIVKEYPQLEALMGTLVVAVDEEMVPTEHVLEDGATVELIPPIAGGC
jgi:molybdopterin converting factor small subunit